MLIPPCAVSANFTCLGWWLGVEFASSATMSSNESLYATGATVGEYEATAVPHLVITIPSIKLKILSLIMSNWDSE